jgi:carbon-monoxide dehydrogenase medium subunit
MLEAEALLLGQKAGPDIFRAAAETCRAIEALDDAHVSATYRKQLATVLSRRCLEAALARCHAQAAGAQRKDVKQ